MNVRAHAVLLAAATALAVSGCAGLTPAGSVPAGPASAGPTSAGTVTSGVPTRPAKARPAPPAQPKAHAQVPRAPHPTVTVKPILPDGKSDAYLKKIDARKRTVTFDLIVFLKDPERMRRWLKDNPGQTDGPDNDYLIQNDNPKLRTLPVVAGARIRTLDWDSGNGVSVTRAQTLDQLAASIHTGGLPYTLTVRGGKVVGITEIYLP
jgi:hypothetical protein